MFKKTAVKKPFKGYFAESVSSPTPVQAKQRSADSDDGMARKRRAAVAAPPSSSKVANSRKQVASVELTVVNSCPCKPEPEEASKSNTTPNTSFSDETSKGGGYLTPPGVDNSKSKELSESQIQRLNRNYVRQDEFLGEYGGRVFWESTPPPGLSKKELSRLDSLAKQRPVKNVSPSIFTAEKYKVKPKPVLKVAKSSQELEDLLSKFNKRKLMKAQKENTTPPSQIKRKSPEVLSIAASHSPSPTKAPTSTNSSMDTSFPEFNDSLNDSALMRCTRAAEQEFFQDREEVICHNGEPSGLVLNLVGSAKKSPLCASTPVDNNGRMQAGRRRTGQTPTFTPVLRRSLRNTSHSDASLMNGSSDMFQVTEEPDSDNRSRTTRRRATPTNTPKSMPRKSLFSNVKEQKDNNSNVSPKTVGEFYDDDDDDIFSQIEIPGDSAGVHNNNENVADMSTLIIQDESRDDSLMKSSFLRELDNLEFNGLGLTSKPKAVSSPAPSPIRKSLRRAEYQTCGVVTTSKTRLNTSRRVRSNR